MQVSAHKVPNDCEIMFPLETGAHGGIVKIVEASDMVVWLEGRVCYLWSTLECRAAFRKNKPCDGREASPVVALGLVQARPIRYGSEFRIYRADIRTLRSWLAPRYSPT